MANRHSDQLDGDELIFCLKQLIISFSPYLRDIASAEEAEEAIGHMEEVDPNFHRYEFVKRLRMQMESSLGLLIEKEIEYRGGGAEDPSFGQQSLINHITDNIIKSEQYRDLTQTLKENVNDACEFLVDNFDKEFLGGGSQRQGNRSPRQKADIIFSDGESSLGDSSLNQSAFMFMNNEQLLQVAEALDKSSPLEMRREALHSLTQMSTIDVQNCETWNNMKRGLQDALGDTDDVLWNTSIKFIARGFSSNSPATREMYTTLVEFLLMQFNTSRKASLPKVKNGCDCRKLDNNKLLKALRLMNEFQQQVPQYWVRYPERFLDEVLESTLSLFVIQSSLSMTPLHYIALIDPKANWFTMWMHGNYSRAPLLAMLENHSSIIESAVQACLDFAASRKFPFDSVSEVADAHSRASSEGHRVQYTGSELEFVYFIHSLCFIGQLLCYENGRKFFPLKLKDREELVTVPRLLVSLIQILTAQQTYPVPHRYASAHYDPGLLVVDVFCRLCTSETVMAKCICKDDVTNALLAPVSACLEGSADANHVQTNETTLLQLADILSVIASSSRGRQHLLYGESQERFTRARPKRRSSKSARQRKDTAGQKTRSSPAFVLAEFSKKALADELSRELGQPPSKAVIGSFVYVCRQLYNTCEGHLVMYSFDLHTHIANAWKQAVREADNAATPTPSMEGSEHSSLTRESQYILIWEDTLRDNLLNFAGTPKGLLLLQLTGAMNECVSYMYSRYARKLQVSKCEKFGYGYMMSQVAATAPGMVALQNAGFIEALLWSLWGALEVVDDSPVYTPCSWPVNTLDKSVRKSFSNLVNLLSSFCAVYEVLGDQPLPTKEEYSFREIPETIPELIDRLVVIDSDAKVHSLFNFEQSHVFGLRLVSTMMTCLDTLLLLQTQYSILDVLLKAQDENVTEEGSGIILDLLSVERNYLLVRAYLIGGPSERIIPPRMLLEDKGNPYPFPLFSSYPVPREYIPSSNGTKSAMKHENELSKFLSDTKAEERGQSWLDSCKKAFCQSLSSKMDTLRCGLLAEMAERSVDVLATSHEDAIFPLMDYMANDQQVKSFKLSTLQQEGIKMAVRYGLHLKLLSSRSDSTQKLTLLLKQCGVFLQQQQRNTQSSSLRCLQKSYPGFDWFLATVFLMFTGNVERSWNFIHSFSSLAHSAYLWRQRLYASVHLKPAMMNSSILPVLSSTCHNIELLLQADIPHVYSAFKMSGYSPAQICQHWISQCFWNYLDWAEIVQYLTLCLMMGIDYQVYVCVAILRFLQRDILQHMQEQDLIVFLKEEPIRGFRMADHMMYMQQLEGRFRRTILKDMLNVSRP